MPNSFDFNPRSPSNRRLAVVGACFSVVAALVAVAMVAKSKGRFDELVHVKVEMVNIGDGLPANSDVKFRGVLVGSVSDVTPSRHGKPNIVHADLKPEYASMISNTVTARVVPTNIFAVSAIQLVDNGAAGESLRDGAVVREDTTLPTVLFQNVLAKVRELLAAVGRKPDDNSLGLIATLGEATRDRGDQLTDAGHDLNDILTQLNTVVSADDTGPSTLSALTAATDGLRQASPELFDALDTAVAPMRTFVEKRDQLTTFISGGLNTVGILGDAFDHQTDRLITIGTELTPVLGVLGEHAGEFHGISTRMQTVAQRFYEKGWRPAEKMFNVIITAGLTPTRTYVRADCPRYGALEGPSCQNAPEVPTAADLYPALGSVGVVPAPGVTENRPNVTPPRHSMPGDPQGPPAPPPSPWQTIPRTPNSTLVQPEPPAPPRPPVPGAPPADVQPSSAVIGGNVGPVGSRQEKEQIDQIVGGSATVATQLLLGPVVRGSTVVIEPDPGGNP